MKDERTLARSVGLGARGFAIYGLLEQRLPERQRLEGDLPERSPSQPRRLEGRLPERDVSERQRLKGDLPERNPSQPQRLEERLPERRVSERQRLEGDLPERSLSRRPQRPMAVGEEAATYDAAACHASDRDPASLVDLASLIDQEVAPFTELVDWWQKDDVQRRMRSRIKRRLRAARVDAEAVESLAADIVDLARVRADR